MSYRLLRYHLVNQHSRSINIQGHENYCPNNPDDPSCSEFLHDVKNKKTSWNWSTLVHRLLILVVLKIQFF